MTWKCLAAITLGALLGGTTYGAELPVQVLKRDVVRTSTGTGSVVRGQSGRRYILTNYHVCRGSARDGALSASDSDGHILYGQIIREAPAVDLCAAQVGGEGPALIIGQPPRPQQDVWSYGYPAGNAHLSKGRIGLPFSWSYVFPASSTACPAGLKAASDAMGRSTCQATFHSTRTDLYSEPGSSGSPVVDEGGGLVGVISSFNPDDAYDAGLVKYEDLKAFLEEL